MFGTKIFGVLLAGVVGVSYGALASRGTQEWWSGSVEFSNYSMNVEMHPGYADIQEEAEILAVAGSWGTTTTATTLEIFGLVVFPDNAAVTGLLLWNGSELLKAKLKPTTVATAEYENVVDRNSASVSTARDPALLTRGSGSYSLSIYPVALNQSRRIRIRYLVPLAQTDSSSTLTINPVFATGSAVSVLNLTVTGNSGAMVVGHDGVNTQYTGSFAASLNNCSSLSLSVPVEKARGLRTSFVDGEWKGHYFFLKSGVPDSLLGIAGLRRELVVIWRWNFPEYYTDYNGVPTAYGSQAITQASKIREAMDWMTYSDPTLEFGMVHSPQSNVYKTFPLAKPSETGFEDLYDYLGTINWSNLASMVPAYPNKEQKSTDSEIRKIKAAGRADFDSMMTKSIALFSPEEGVLKHIVVLLAGAELSATVPNDTDIASFAALQGISMSGGVVNNYKATLVYGGWPGVNVPAVAAGKEYSGTLNTMFSIPIPPARQLHYSVSLRYDGLDHYYELSGNIPRLQFAAHTLNPVDSILTWRALDQNGTEVASYQQILSSHVVDNDTGIVKIVGAQDNLVDDVYPSREFGAAYGVVRNDYALVALPEDTLTDSLSSVLENGGLPHLTKDEIYVPEPASTLNSHRVINKKIIVQYLGHSRFGFQLGTELCKISKVVEVVSLHGRVVAHFSADRFADGSMVQWDGSAYAPGVYFLRVKTKTGSVQQQFFLQ